MCFDKNMCDTHITNKTLISLIGFAKKVIAINDIDNISFIFLILFTNNKDIDIYQYGSRIIAYRSLSICSKTSLWRSVKWRVIIQALNQ